MKRRVVEVVEGSPVIGLAGTDLLDLNRARIRLKDRLRPRLNLFEDTTQGCVPSNVIGTISLNARTILRVTPKVGDRDDWVGAALDLMVPERASVAGHRQAARTGTYNSLESGLAAIYRERLERALRAEGPIEVMHTEFAHSGALAGRLDVERWVLEKPFRQFTFPVHRSVLDSNNELTAALALAATILSRSVSVGTLRNALVKLSHDVRPGLPDAVAVDPSIIGRALPQQWSAYNEAWSIAQVVLSNSRFASRHGTLSGVEVALEPWVLLEELLDRTVREVVRRGRADGYGWQNQRHPAIELLQPGTQPPASAALARLLSKRTVYPENLIVGPAGPVASFEAKYSRPRKPESIRNHMYQLLTTAAHAGSPKAILIYPELSEPIRWHTADSRTPVKEVFAVGLNLFGYSKRGGVGARAQQIYDLLILTADSGEHLTSRHTSKGLVELIVERGAGALDTLPDAIKNNPEAVAETIINNVRRTIVDERAMNPKYYDRMSSLLDTIIEQRRQNATKYAAYLAQLLRHAEMVGQGESDSGVPYPDWANTPARRALVDFAWPQGVEINVEYVHDRIQNAKQHGWADNPIMEHSLASELRKVLPSDFEAERLKELIGRLKEHNEYR